MVKSGMSCWSPIESAQAMDSEGVRWIDRLMAEEFEGKKHIAPNSEDGHTTRNILQHSKELVTVHLFAQKKTTLTS